MLEAERQGIHIAKYFSYLPANLQTKYADFLFSIEDEKVKYFDLGNNHGLDMKVITANLVSSIFKRGSVLDYFSNSNIPDYQFENLNKAVDTPDMFQIKALEWVSIEEEQEPVLLEYGNQLVRHFLSKFSVICRVWKDKQCSVSFTEI